MVDWNDEKECMDAVKKGITFSYIETSKKTLLKAIPVKNKVKYKYVKTTEVDRMALKNGLHPLQLVKNKTPDICLEAIKRDKDAIRFVPKEFVEIHKLWRLMYE